MGGGRREGRRGEEKGRGRRGERRGGGGEERRRGGEKWRVVDIRV